MAYDCGAPGVRAEQQFVFGPNDMPAASREVQAFVNRICAGHVVIVCEPLGPVIRALRGDGVSRLARFSADPRHEFARRTAGTEIFAWTAGRWVGPGQGIGMLMRITLARLGVAATPAGSGPLTSTIWSVEEFRSKADVVVIAAGRR